MTDALIKPMTEMTLPEKLDYIRKDLIDDGAIQKGSAWDASFTEAIQALSVPGDAQMNADTEWLRHLGNDLYANGHIDKHEAEEIGRVADRHLRRPAEPVVTERMVEAAYSARIPGGSQAHWWFAPHADQKGQNNIKGVITLMLEAALNVSQPGVK